MEFELLGDESVGPTLRLDHEQFAYAGKFVMSSGKTVLRDDGNIVGAVAFTADSTDETTVHLRYVTVREDRRGEGLGPELLRFTAAELRDQYDTVAIAVNNPIAYEACYRAGFAYTGAETGIAEVRLAYRPDDRDTEAYQRGFSVFQTRDLPPEHEAIIPRYKGSDPPDIVDVPAANGDD